MTAIERTAVNQQSKWGGNWRKEWGWKA